MKKIYLTLLVLVCYIGANAQNLPVPAYLKTPPFASTSNGLFGVEMNGKYYFVYGGHLWESNGTTWGTFDIKDLNGVSSAVVAHMRVANNKIFMAVDDKIHGFELWVSDGTANGTQLVKDINTGLADGFMRKELAEHTIVSLNSEVFFYGHDGINGIELWKSDGTDAGTKMVKEINTKPASGILDTSINGTPSLYLLSHAGKVYFTADDSVNGPELWVTDGTAGGTSLIMDILPGNPIAGNTGPEVLTPFGNKVIFNVGESATTAAMYMTDGTLGGTIKITNAVFLEREAEYAEINGKLYFYGVDNSSSPTFGIYVTDGTQSGTSFVKEIITSGLISATARKLFFLTVYNNKIFFSAKASSPFNAQVELWSSDGTGPGTVQFKDLTPYGNNFSSQPTQLINFGGKLYMRATDTNGRSEIWACDGTDAGTKMLKYPGADYTTTSQLAMQNGRKLPITKVGNSLFFWNNYKVSEGFALYKLDMFPDAISDVNKHENVWLYPNPATNTITIDAQHVSNISICNMAGMQVMATSNTTIDIVTLQAGLYTATVSYNDGARQVVKFVKQ